ncbi:MAG: ketoacyl-ACP synthase III [Alistipes sp.]
MAVRGVAACVPVYSEANDVSPVFASQEDAARFMDTTGIENRRIVDERTTSSDLCLQAAEKLIADLQWEKDSIDCLVFVSQTPDYILPATSCLLQSKLGLSTACYTLDISLGCSGWVHGLSVIASLLAGGGVKRGLLLAGDTISKICSKQDKSTYPLFGDAGSATALEFDPTTQNMMFHFATDGSGSEAIHVLDGGFRNEASAASFDNIFVETGITHNKLQLVLNGMDVFTFGISKAPKSVNQLIEHFDLDKERIDYFVMHQANLFMNEKIRKKLKFDADKVPYSLKDFGNTSCASIPLTMVSNSIFEGGGTRTILGCAFGVGLSWGSVYFQTENIVCPKLIEI